MQILKLACIIIKIPINLFCHSEQRLKKKDVLNPLAKAKGTRLLLKAHKQLQMPRVKNYCGQPEQYCRGGCEVSREGPSDIPSCIIGMMHSLHSGFKS